MQNDEQTLAAAALIDRALYWGKIIAFGAAAWWIVKHDSTAGALIWLGALAVWHKE